jgi:hypothetical protein
MEARLTLPVSISGCHTRPCQLGRRSMRGTCDVLNATYRPPGGEARDTPLNEARNARAGHVHAARKAGRCAGPDDAARAWPCRVQL